MTISTGWLALVVVAGLGDPGAAQAARFKVQLHVHTTRSDGKASPEQALQFYRQNGYDAVAITEHDSRIGNVTVIKPPAGMVLLPSIENSNNNHVLSLNIGSQFAGFDGTTVPEYQALIDQNAARGGFTVLAHPNWSGAAWSTAEMASLHGYAGVEVYNASNGVETEIFAEDRWIDLLSRGRTDVYPFATDDCHFGDGTRSICNRGWIGVFAPRLDAGSLVAAVGRGDLYASTGLEIASIEQSGNTLTVTADEKADWTFLACNGTVVARASGLSASALIPPGQFLVAKGARHGDPKALAWSRAFVNGPVSCPLRAPFIDAAVDWGNGKLYFLQGPRYVRYDRAADRADRGYPQLIGDHWPGLPREGVDAVLPWDDKNTFFFKGPLYWKYNRAKDRVEEGYPKPIAGNWPGVWAEGVDAALNPHNGSVYFFRGTQYVRYNVRDDRADKGYPLPLAGHWPGVAFDRIDDVMELVQDGRRKIYFFRGDEYIRFDWADDRADGGYPKPIRVFWHGL